MPLTLTRELASHFARTALSHVTREYPNKLDHVLTGPEDVKSPRALHPIFYGSFDWHSCVHGYWTLARCLRRFPDLPEAGAVRALFDEQLTPEKVEGEVAYLARPSARGFERPYGWAWALKLQSELLLCDNADGERWSHTLQPLAEAFAERFRSFLPLATYPIRSGLHPNTAFALLLALDYAAAADKTPVANLCNEKAFEWYEADANAGFGEPSQSDFLSPSLIEGALMARVLQADRFAVWFGRFLAPSAQARRGKASAIRRGNLRDGDEGDEADRPATRLRTPAALAAGRDGFERQDRRIVGLAQADAGQPGEGRAEARRECRPRRG